MNAQPPQRYVLLRVAVAAIVIASFAVLAVLPRHWVTSRARYDGDSGDPRYDVPISHRALLRAGEILHRAGGTYYVHVRPHAPVLRGNLNGALRLWSPPALPLAWPAHPDWVLSYRTAQLLPPELRAARAYELGTGIQLVEIAR